ncbi:MAG: hypothetical protein PHE04_03725 [Bacteroidales bacterium]|nr:hypothetical protein [Bacteroidales bacterium]MDD3430816.1 hypothetical protein [Bacteroidales bacterium]MDD4361529.1 hypothetical protein [Bacteroidales bacterium]MDD4430205.1 hypothetical protein [Bacteroidales bacterium]
MMKKRLGLIFLFFCLVAGASAQFYSGGTDPARLKWQQLNTENFRLIYPEGIDSLALRYAWLLQTAGIHSVEGLRVEAPKKLPVVLHPYTTRSNGFVVWAPRRMELFCLPSPDGEPQNWEISLALHESRHVGQMQWAGKGLFSKLYWFMGEQSQGLAAGLFDVFSVGLLEGDAVMTETAYSAAGRGRQAEFLMPYKAYFMDSVQFSLDKWHFGSQKHFIPNEYALGYLKLSAGTYLNSSSALPSVFRDISSNPFSYNKTYKQNFGSNFYQLFKPASGLYKQMWLDETAAKAPFDSPDLISAQEKRFVSYRSPCFSNQGLLALKESLSEPLSLVRIDDKHKTEHLRWMGDVNSSLVAQGNKVYWTEQVNSPRWVHESYSILLCYDLETKRIQRLSKKSRYYLPALSKDGQQIALASYLIGGGSELQILEASNGKRKQVYSVPFGAQLYEMVWADKAQRIFAVLISDRGAGIYSLDLPSGEWKEQMAPQHRKLSGLHYCKETLCFESDAGGTDNIFRLYLQSGKTYRLTNARFGAFDLCWNSLEDSLYFVNYDKRGYQLAVLPASELKAVEQSFEAGLPARADEANLPDRLVLEKKAAMSPLELADRFTAEGGLVADTMVFPKDLTYPVSKYSKAGHLFNIHSWAPFYYDLDELAAISFDNLHRSLSPGLMFMSQNALSTSVLQAGYAYRRGFHSGHVKYIYSGWYPVLSVEADINDRKVIRQGLSYLDGGVRILSRDTLASVAVDTKLSAYVPLNFDRYGWHRGIVPSVNWQFSNNQFFIASVEQSRYLNTVQAGLQLYCMKSMAPRDLFPRLGAGLNLQLAAAPFNRGYFTDLFYAKGYAYLPGLFKNQGLKVSASYQLHNTQDRNYYLGNAVKLRGSDYINAPEMIALSFDYALPVFPDLSLPGILYLKRMEFYPFVDLLRTYTETPSGIVKESLYSTGLESLFTVNLLRINAEFNLGLRCTYNPAKGMVYELLFSLPYLN